MRALIVALLVFGWMPGVSAQQISEIMAQSTHLVELKANLDFKQRSYNSSFYSEDIIKNIFIKKILKSKNYRSDCQYKEIISGIGLTSKMHSIDRGQYFFLFIITGPLKGDPLDVDEHYFLFLVDKKSDLLGLEGDKMEYFQALVIAGIKPQNSSLYCKLRLESAGSVR
jgi:hypothetical protein